MLLLRIASLVAVLSATTRAQCGTTWLPGDGSAGTDGYVEAATRWDPDGPGPAGDQLVIGGTFHLVGTVPANAIAAFDPVLGQWSPLGTGMSGPVQAVLALPNGDLIAAGQFTVAGGVALNGIARWNGTAWSSVGAGLPLGYNQFGVVALALLPNGDIVAGGQFYPPGGPTSIARWDGTTWSPLGGGVTGAGYIAVRALCVRSNGDLVAAGNFTIIGGVPVTNIASWNGIAWSPLGAGLDSQVQALCELPNGTLVAGGLFANAGGAPAARIASWDGTSWSPLGSGMAAAPWGVFTMMVSGTDLIAGGIFPTAGGVPVNNIARWDGTNWWPLGGGVVSAGSGVFALATLPGGSLVAGGSFSAAGTTPAGGLASWNGTAWSAFATGTDGYLMDMAPLPNGDLVVGGSFTVLGGVLASNVARRTGGTWQALGGGTNALVTSLAVLPNGDIVAGGQFDSAGGAPASRIARWNGTAWSPLGAGVGGTFQPEVWSLAVAANGDLIVGGTFTTAGGAVANRIARWNGTSWSALGSGVADGSNPYVTVDDLTFLPNGDLIAGGDFTTAAGVPVSRIARWNGAVWTSLGTGITLPFGTTYAKVRRLLALPSGDVVAVGHTQAIGGGGSPLLRRWNGASWSSLEVGLTYGNDPVADGLAMPPDGDLVVGLTRIGLPGAAVANSVARWNGSAWSALGTNLTLGVASIVMQQNGTLAVGGSFASIDSIVTVGFGQLVSTCPATAVAAGAGCTGSGGPNVLTADLPWIGGTFHSLATGIPQNGLAASVYGFTPLALPMPIVHPLGQAGCTLWVDDDISLTFPRGNGTVASSLAIPAQASLVGGVFYHQVVAVDIDSVGNLQALTSTNALRLTIGVF